jgi:hypothetical protein
LPLIVTLISSAAAQTSPAKPALTGLVLDPTEASVAGARVSVRRADGAVLAVTTSDAAGGFQFERLAPGTYKISAEHDGFQPATVQARVGARSPAFVNIRLSVAEVRSAVNVTERAAELSTDPAANRDTVVLNRQALDDLPVFDQDYVGAMSRFVDPGSVSTGGVTILVDGVESSRAGVSASAIQEIKINNDPYSAEYPRPGRSRIDIITKPGSSAFHGTFNFIFRDYHLNARDPFALQRPIQTRY